MVGGETLVADLSRSALLLIKVQFTSNVSLPKQLSIRAVQTLYIQFNVSDNGRTIFFQPT